GLSRASDPLESLMPHLGTTPVSPDYRAFVAAEILDSPDYPAIARRGCHSGDDQLSAGVLQDDLLDAVDVGLAHFIHRGRAEEKLQLLSHAVGFLRPDDHTAQRCRTAAVGRPNLSRVETLGDPP